MKSWNEDEYEQRVWEDVERVSPQHKDKARSNGHDSNAQPELTFIDIAAWQDQPVPERQWIVKDRIPANNVTLLSGEGSVGKSILSLQLAVAVVLGRDWINTLPEMGPAMPVCCEDDADELWRRLDLIRQHCSVSFAELKDLHVLSLAGSDTLMAVPDRSGIIKATDLFEKVRAAACRIRPKLIVLDNAADIFGGNENDRAQVRQFIGLLRGLAMAAGAAVLLTSHPSIVGVNTGSGLSGSTAWNASVRSRLYFKRTTAEKDEEPDPDLRVLVVMKANYGPIGETITLRWTNGLFLPQGSTSSLDKIAREAKADEVFLDLLRRFGTEGRNVSDKPTANGYAPTAFAHEAEAKKHRLRKADFEAAMRRLFKDCKIHVEQYGRPSRPASRIAIKS